MADDGATPRSQPPRRRSSSSPAAAAAVFALLLLVCGSRSCLAARDKSNVDQQLDDLRAQVAQLQQQLAAAVAGAEALSSWPAGDAAAAGSGAALQEAAGTPSAAFVPNSANTGRTIARRATSWHQHFAFDSVVAGDGAAAAAAMATDRPGQAGEPMVVVLADAAGWLYVFTPDGHLVREHDTGFGARITALATTLARPNETHVAVGLHDGSLALLVLGHGHGRLAMSEGIHSVHLALLSTPKDRVADRQQEQQQHEEPDSSSGEPAAIELVAFSVIHNRRLVLAADRSGGLVVLAAASGRTLAQHSLASGLPLAMNLHANFQLVVQTPTAATIVLLNRGAHRVTRPCQGLAPPTNSSSGSSSSGTPDASADNAAAADGPDALAAAVFDPSRAFRVFGVTRGGDLVALSVPAGAATRRCQVMQRLPLGLPPGPVRLLMSKGRLLLLHSAGVAAFDLEQHNAQLAGSHLVSVAWTRLWQQHGLEQQHRQLSVDGDAEGGGGGDPAILHTPPPDGSPLLAAAVAASSGLVVLPFGSRGVAMFRIAGSHGSTGGAAGNGRRSSSGTAGRSPSYNPNWLKLLQPLVVIGMLVVGVWQFLRASSRSNLDHFRGGRYSGGGGGGSMLRDDLTARVLAGMGGAAGGLMGGGPQDRDAGSFGLLGDLSAFDRDLGPYAGSRGRREAPLAAHGGLSALNARRRARAAMRPQQQQQQHGGGGLGTTLGSGSSRVAAGVARQQQQPGGGPAMRSALAGSTPAAVIPELMEGGRAAARAVRFEDQVEGAEGGSSSGSDHEEGGGVTTAVAADGPASKRAAAEDEAALDS